VPHMPSPPSNRGRCSCGHWAELAEPYNSMQWTSSLERRIAFSRYFVYEGHSMKCVVAVSEEET